MPHRGAPGGPGGQPEQRRSPRRFEPADELIAELKAGTSLGIGSPMYNFGIVSALKSWFDYVLGAEATSHHTPQGPVRHIAGKRAIIMLTRGGFFSAEDHLYDKDAQEPHLRAKLWFGGIEDVTLLYSERLAMVAEGAAQTAQEAHAALSVVAADALKLTA